MLTYKIDIEALRQVLGDHEKVDLTLFKPRTGNGETAREDAENSQENPLDML